MVGIQVSVTLFSVLLARGVLAQSAYNGTTTSEVVTDATTTSYATPTSYDLPSTFPTLTSYPPATTSTISTSSETPSSSASPTESSSVVVSPTTYVAPPTSTSESSSEASPTTYAETTTPVISTSYTDRPAPLVPSTEETQTSLEVPTVYSAQATETTPTSVAEATTYPAVSSTSSAPYVPSYSYVPVESETAATSAAATSAAATSAASASASAYTYAPPASSSASVVSAASEAPSPYSYIPNTVSAAPELTATYSGAPAASTPTGGEYKPSGGFSLAPESGVSAAASRSTSYVTGAAVTITQAVSLVTQNAEGAYMYGTETMTPGERITKGASVIGMDVNSGTTEVWAHAGTTSITEDLTVTITAKTSSAKIYQSTNIVVNGHTYTLKGATLGASGMSTVKATGTATAGALPYTGAASKVGVSGIAIGAIVGLAALL